MASGADEILWFLWADAGGDDRLLALINEARAELDAAYTSSGGAGFGRVASMYSAVLAYAPELRHSELPRALTQAHMLHVLGEDHFFSGRYRAAMRNFNAAVDVLDHVVTDTYARALRSFYLIEALEAGAFAVFSEGDALLARRAHDIELRLTARALAEWPRGLPLLRSRLKGHLFYGLSRMCLVNAVLSAAVTADPAGQFLHRTGGGPATLWLFWSMALERYSEQVNPMWR